MSLLNMIHIANILEKKHLKLDKNISNSKILYVNKNYKFGIINCKQNC